MTLGLDYLEDAMEWRVMNINLISMRKKQSSLTAFRPLPHLDQSGVVFVYKEEPL